MKNIVVLLMLTLAVFSACQTEKVIVKEIVIRDTVVVKEFSYDYMLLAVLWYQTSAEMRALCYQAFNTATMMLDQAVAANKENKKLAVVVDIDETMVDNSPYEAANVIGNFGYPEKWGDWINMAGASAIPGAVDFMKYAVSKGVDVYYISNRKIAEKDATVKNMKALGFPMVDDEHLLLRDKTSSKIERRDVVAKTHQIVMLIGDNMNDFSGVFENKNVEDRFAVTDSLRSEYGKRFIVLPNPMYGDWESAVMNYNFKRSNEQKDSIRKASLRGF